METPKPQTSYAVSIHQNREDTHTWVATARRQFGDPAPVSFASITTGPGFVLMHSVVTNPKMRRRGAARKVVQEMILFCEKTFPNWIVYLTAVPYGSDSTSQEALFVFYSQVGFTRTPGHPFEMVRVAKRN